MSCGGCGGKVTATLAKLGHGAAGLTQAALRINRPAEAVIAQRLDACRLCIFSTKNPSRKTATGLPLVSRCLKCSCLLHAKTAVAGEACPIGKWGKADKIGSPA